MKEEQIKQLVEQMEKGDQTAYKAMYEETQKGVYFICISFLHNEEDAKDAMQDTYLTAFKKLSQLREKEKFIPWLNQIAVNKCKKLLQKNAPVLIEEEDLNQLQAEENENFLPEEYITKKAKRKIVMDIMRKELSDIQYQTVILFYFNNLTIEEIADIMECPPGTVKYRLSISRTKIKEGVLEYEKKSKDKLYSFVGIPFLTSLFAVEVDAMEAPDIWSELSKKINTNSGSTKNELSMSENPSLKGKRKHTKIILGVAVAAVTVCVAVGITSAINKNNADNDFSDKNITSNTQTEFAEVESEENANIEETYQSDVEAETTNADVHEAFKLQIRWLTSCTGQAFL